jgi:hypothetical protein
MTNATLLRTRVAPNDCGIQRGSGCLLRAMEGSAIIVQTHCCCLIRQHQEKVLRQGVMDIQQVFSELKVARDFSNHLICKDHRPGADDRDEQTTMSQLQFSHHEVVGEVDDTNGCYPATLGLLQQRDGKLRIKKRPLCRYPEDQVPPRTSSRSRQKARHANHTPLCVVNLSMNCMAQASSGTAMCPADPAPTARPGVPPGPPRVL